MWLLCAVHTAASIATVYLRLDQRAADGEAESNAPRGAFDRTAVKLLEDAFDVDVARIATEVLDRASPIRFVDRTDPPVLLIHGLDDTNVRASQSEHFAQQLRAAGSTAELVLIPSVKHGFIGATDAATKDALRQALTATFDFFDRVLQNPPTAAH